MKVLVLFALTLGCCSAAKRPLQSHRPLFSSFFNLNNDKECENGLGEKCTAHDTTTWSHRPQAVQGLSQGTLTCSSSSFDLSVTSPPEVTSVRFRVVQWQASTDPRVSTGSYVSVDDNPKCATGWSLPVGFETTTQAREDPNTGGTTVRTTQPAPNIEDPFGHWRKRSVTFQQPRGSSHFGLDYGECKQQVLPEDPDCSTGTAQAWTQQTPIVEVTEKISTDNPNIMILTTTYLEINCITLLNQADTMDVAPTQPEAPVGEVAQCQSCPSELSVAVDNANSEVAVTVKRACALGPTADSQLGWFVDSLTYNDQTNLIVQDGAVTDLGDNVEAALSAWTSADEYTVRSDSVVDSANDELRAKAKISYCLKDDKGDSGVQMCDGVRLCSSGEKYLPT
ncbi:hypothetical protein RvY_12306 [Ramazzottius varieornatus]|uniref:Uncharacterized protein n=1 Tax=Ramazzottius varieornatus TaxID=947166 RepID=A0A1D1VJ44_RAMVA|nr:hypothetical protein RvY_12306 [Ramazzottius varieornatus]